MKPVDYKNTRGSNMDEPLWFDPNGKRPDNLPPEENARRDALLKKLEETCKEWKKEFQAGQPSSK